METLVSNKKKYLGSLAFLVLLMGVTFYFLFKDNPIPQLLETIRQVNPFFLLLGVLSMFGFICCEAGNTKIIMESLRYKISFLRHLKYSFVGFYFSSITPSASGGQPMQMYYMKRDGVNLSISSLTYLILIAVYQIVMLGYGVVMFFLKREFVTASVNGIGILLIYGFTINILLIGFIICAIFSKKLIRRFLFWGIRILSKIRIIKHTEQVMENTEHQLLEYQQGAQHIRKHPGVLIKVFLVTILQLTLSFLVPFFVYCSFGLTGHGLLEILAVQSLLTIAVSSLPLPGAVGASESGFMTLFRLFFPSAMLLPAMLLSRGISFYLMLFISGAVSMITHCQKSKKIEREAERSALNAVHAPENP